MELTMTRTASIILATAELLNHELRALHDRHHLGDDHRSIERRTADFQPGIIAKGQHSIELDLLAGREIAEIDVQFLALFYFQLAAAIFDDCVHDSPTSISSVKPCSLPKPSVAYKGVGK